MLGRLGAGGFETMDLSQCAAAQVHLRHLVGGRARSFMGVLPDEHIFTVDFPERPGALDRFLAAIDLNITLFHYRQSGNRVTQVLVGVQLPPGTEAQFKTAAARLDYKFEEIEGVAYDAFSRFIY